MRQRTGTVSDFPFDRVMRSVRSCCGFRFGPRPTMSYVSVPSSFNVCAVVPSLNCNGSTPMPTRFERWMRSKLCATTTLTPSRFVPFAAQSRELPVPYSWPASTISGVFFSACFIAAPRTVAVEVRVIDSVLDQIFSRRRRFLDAARRRNMVGRHAVAEDAERARAPDLVNFTRLQTKLCEERRLLNVGAFAIPLVHIADARRNFVPF